MWLVARYGRRRVLRMWLDNVPFGRSDILGIRNAAERYLGKPLEALDAIDGLLLGERATVYTGRYYVERTERLARWALRNNLLPPDALTRIGERRMLMLTRVPSQ